MALTLSQSADCCGMKIIYNFYDPENFSPLYTQGINGQSQIQADKDKLKAYFDKPSIFGGSRFCQVVLNESQSEVFGETLRDHGFKPLIAGINPNSDGVITLYICDLNPDYEPGGDVSLDDDDCDDDDDDGGW